MQKSENNSEDSAELEKIALQNRKREATLKAYNDERARIIENNLVELGEGEDSAKHGGKLLVSALNGTLDSEGARTIAGNKNLLVTFNALVGSELDSGDVDTLSDEILNAVDARLELMQKSRIESRELQNEASLGRAGKAYLEQLKVPGYYTNDFVHYYTAGLLGESISKANESLDSPMPHIMKVYALKAGRLDRTEYRNASGAKSKIITKAGFIENKYSSHLSAAEKNELGAIARALGYNIGYMAPTGEGGDDAKVDRDNGIIWIARDNESPVRTLIVHELTHVFATRDPAAFEKYVRIAVADMQRHRTFDSKINDMLDRYEAAEHYIDRMAALEEIGAYYTGELLERTDLYSAILNKNRSLGTRLRDALANVINRIKSAFGKGGSLDNYGVSLAQSQRALTAWTRMLEQTKSDVAKANKREEKAERKKENDGQGLNSDDGILDFTDESEDASIDEGIEQELMAIAAEDDIQESAPADEKHSLKKVEKYSYEALISKEDIPIVHMKNISNDTVAHYREDTVTFGKDMMARVAMKRHPLNTAQKTYIHCNDIDKDILISRRSFKHSAARMDKTYLQVCMNISGILENAIAINELQSRNDREVNARVLIGVAENEGNYVLVRFIVENRTWKLENYDILCAINKTSIKKEDVGVKPQAFTVQKNGVSQTSSTISISNLLENVKREKLFLDVVSDDVANRLGVSRTAESESNIKSVMYSIKNSKSDAPIELHEIADMASQMAGVDELGSINNAAAKEISELLKIPVSSIERLRELHREYRKNTSDQKALSTFCDACFRQNHPCAS